MRRMRAQRASPGGAGFDRRELAAKRDSLQCQLIWMAAHLMYRDISHALGNYLHCYGDELPWTRIYAADHPLWEDQRGLLTQTWDKDHALNTPIVFFTLINRKRKAFGGGTWDNKGKSTSGNFTITKFYYKRAARANDTLPRFTLLEFVLEMEPTVAICAMHPMGYTNLYDYLNQAAGHRQRQMYMTQIMNGNTLGGNNASFHGNNNENYGYSAPPHQTPISSTWPVNYRMDDTVPANSLVVPQDSYNTMQNQNDTNFGPYDPSISLPLSVTGATGTDNAMPTNLPWDQSVTRQHAFDGIPVEQFSNTLPVTASELNNILSMNEQYAPASTPMQEYYYSYNNQGYGNAAPAEFATPDYNRLSSLFPLPSNNVPNEQYAADATPMQDYSYNVTPIQTNGPEQSSVNHNGQNAMLPEQGAHADQTSLQFPIMPNPNSMNGALHPLPESFPPYGLRDPSHHELSQFDEVDTWLCGTSIANILKDFHR